MANQIPQKVRVVHPVLARKGIYIPGTHLSAYEHRGYIKESPPAPPPVEAKKKTKKEKPAQDEILHSEE